jgi:hypothetical protein
VGTPKAKKPLERPSSRWEDIKMDITEIGLECVAGVIMLMIGNKRWVIRVNTATNFRALKNAENFYASRVAVIRPTLRRRTLHCGVT